MFEHVNKNEELIKQMKSGKKLYGENVGKKFISIISDLIKKEKPFKWAHEAIGLWKEKDDMDYL